MRSVRHLEKLTAQDLIACADGLRALVTQCEADAAARVNPTTRQIPLEAAQAYRELAAQCEVMAKSGGQPDSQTLIYCAAGQRVRAIQSEREAETQATPRQREIKLAAARAHLDLAARCERMAESSGWVV